MGRLFEFDRSVLLQVQAVVHKIQRGIGWTSQLFVLDRLRERDRKSLLRTMPEVRKEKPK